MAALAPRLAWPRVCAGQARDGSAFELLRPMVLPVDQHCASWLSGAGLGHCAGGALEVPALRGADAQMTCFSREVANRGLASPQRPYDVANQYYLQHSEASSPHVLLHIDERIPH